MSEPSELHHVIGSVVTTLRRHGVTYFITGSLASSIHGEFRATNDLDIVVDLDRRRLPALMEDFSTDFIADSAQAVAALTTGTSFNLLHRGTYLKVDVFPCVTAFDHEAMRRAEHVPLPGGHEPLRVSTKEDILLAKLHWYRLGQETSERQRRDIESLVALNRDALDTAHLARWGAVLGVDDLLRGFLATGQ